MIWDVLFLDGSITLFKAALGIFKSIKRDIMKQNSIESIFDSIEQTKTNLDIAPIIYYLILRKFEFDTEIINKNRILFEENVIETMFKNKQEKMKKDKLKMIESLKNKNEANVRKNSYFHGNEHCCTEWQLCIYDTYYKHDITNFLIFRQLELPEIIENYFFSKSNENCSNRSNYESHNSNEISTLIENKKQTSRFKTVKEKFSRLLGNPSMKHSRNGAFSVENSVDKFSMISEMNDDDLILFEEVEKEEEFFKINKDVFPMIKTNLNEIEEIKKYRVYKNLLIERHPHYCSNLNIDTNLEPYHKDVLQFETPDDKKKNIRNNYIKYKIESGNKSFTAMHPYFIEFYKSNDHKIKTKKELVYSNFISSIGKSYNQFNKDILESITPRAFNDNDFFNSPEKENSNFIFNITEKI